MMVDEPTCSGKPKPYGGGALLTARLTCLSRHCTLFFFFFFELLNCLFITLNFIWNPSSLRWVAMSFKEFCWTGIPILSLRDLFAIIKYFHVTVLCVTGQNVQYHWTTFGREYKRPYHWFVNVLQRILSQWDVLTLSFRDVEQST